MANLVGIDTPYAKKKFKIFFKNQMDKKSKFSKILSIYVYMYTFILVDNSLHRLPIQAIS